MPIYVKETLINLTSMVAIATPILVIIYPDERKNILYVLGAMMVLTLLYPPTFSWMRPHRHSDVPYNRNGLKE